MLTNWISPDALRSLNEGFVVAIMLEAKEGQGEALAEILRVMTPPTMAEPGVKLFLSYRSPKNPLQFFVFELYVNEAAWGAHEATDHFKTAVAQLLPRVTRRERVPFVPFLTHSSIKLGPSPAASCERGGLAVFTPANTTGRISSRRAR